MPMNSKCRVCLDRCTCTEEQWTIFMLWWTVNSVVIHTIQFSWSLAYISGNVLYSSPLQTNIEYNPYGRPPLMFKQAAIEEVSDFFRRPNKIVLTWAFKFICTDILGEFYVLLCYLFRRNTITYTVFVILNKYAKFRTFGRRIEL